MANQNLLVITGDRLPHKYFVNQLSNHFKLSAVFIETVQYSTLNLNSEKGKKIWNEFFLNRQKTEESLLRFSDTKNQQISTKKFTIKRGALNKNKTLEHIQDFNPAKIIIFGTSLLGSKYLKLYPNRILNLHVGLSQYYRGSFCNFWPIHDLKPQLLGATVHFVSNGIDDGNIVVQKTIDLDKNDSVYILITKPIILGTKLMIEAIKDPNSELTRNEKIKIKGKLSQIKDFNPKAILKVTNLASSGELKNKIELENVKTKKP